MIARARVTADHDPPPGDPLEFQAGDPLRIGPESASHPGWWRVTDPRGVSGWAPESHVRVRGAGGSALLPYTSRELKAAAGETVGVDRELFGWAWCEGPGGETGWLPLEKLERLPAE